MISNNSPWSGLVAGQVDTRRVDAHGRWNFFWAVMPKADPALVLQLSALPSPQPSLPKLKSLDIGFQTLPGGPILYLRLRDLQQVDLFETLCRDVFEATKDATTETEALDRAIGRTFRWHRMLRGGGSDLLTAEAQKGLVGELRVLRRLVDKLGAQPALASWTGPADAPKDFELAGDCIEVKARRIAAQPFVRISNEFQLADVPDRRLWLAVLAVDRVQSPHGNTLNEIVNDLTAQIQTTAPAAILDWELHLADAGYDSEHDYTEWRWLATDPEYYGVYEGFPRIASPVAQGVSNVTYALALSAIAPFLTSTSTVETCLFGTNPDE